MKTKLSLVLLATILATILAPIAYAADKYVSKDFGFAASYPAVVVRSQVNSDSAGFVANAPGGAWVAEVKVAKNVAMPREITKEFMEAKLAEALKAGFMTQTGASSYTTFHGNPALAATATAVVGNTGTNFVPYPVLLAVDLKLVFVKSDNLVKGQNRIYLVDGRAIQGQDRSGINLFLNSFELR